MEERTQRRMEGCKHYIKCMLPPLSMVVAQLIMTGMLILARIILSKGTFVYSFVAYRSAVAAVSVAPFACFFEREMLRRMSWSAFIWSFFAAIFGITVGIGFYYYGLQDTTATYSSCFYNLIPIITFIFAIFFRMESLELGSRAGQTKAFGVILSVAGAMFISLYRGQALHLWPTAKGHKLVSEIGAHHWLRGTLFLLASCISDAIWYIVLVKSFKVYSSKYWAQTLTCTMGFLQCVVVGLLLDHQKAAWKLGWNLQLLVIVYAGALNTGLSFCLTSWVASQRGPAYPSVFNSLSLIFTAIAESLLFGEDITIGSLLGILLIIGGVYSFLWGKAKETSLHGEDKSQRDTTTA